MTKIIGGSLSDTLFTYTLFTLLICPTMPEYPKNHV